MSETLPPVPVALIDDHTLVREALAAIINGIPGFKVVVEAVNGADYVRAARAGAVVSIAVVDLHMPIMDGFQTITWLRNNRPGTRAIALTFDASDEALAKALRSGACGFLRKDVHRNEFQRALQEVAITGRYVAKDPQDKAPGGEELNREAVLAQFSDREHEFIKHVCDEKELTYEQIAELMGAHRRTVDGYRESVFEKCKVKTKSGLVLFAYKWGLLGTEW